MEESGSKTCLDRNRFIFIRTQIILCTVEFAGDWWRPIKMKFGKSESYRPNTTTVTKRINKVVYQILREPNGKPRAGINGVDL